MNLYELSVTELIKGLKNREFSTVDVVNSYFERIEEVEPKVDAFLTLTKEEALKRAEELQEKLNNNEKLGMLFGVPIAIKDAICTNGIRTTAASKMLENFVPPYDATVIEYLKNEDAIIIGKTNMDEFAMGSSTEHSAFKTTKNPHDLARIPGGSSGGSAVAVASFMAPCALGSDTGGSIRQPACHCGIVGMKPTYGLVSRYGLIAYASSFDQIGPFTRNVEDMALIMNTIVGHDKKDSTSIPREKEDYTKFLIEDVKNIRIGIPKEFFTEGLDSEIKESVMAAAEKYRELGATVEECSLNIAEYSLAVYYVVACAEAASNLARFDGIRYGYRSPNATTLEEVYKKTRREGFGDEVKRRIFLGTSVLSSGYSDKYYSKAQEARNAIKAQFAECFEKYDFILTPTSPCAAFKFGEKTSNPLEMYLSDIYTVPVNTAGLPAISIPCGFNKNGLPIGMQLIGNYFSEGKMLQTAYTYEKSTNWNKKPEFKEV